MNESKSTPVQISLAELTGRYLRGQLAAESSGFSALPAGEVIPHDAVPVQAIDPQIAWGEALAAGRFFGVKTDTWSAPQDWTSLVAAQEPASALPFCVGNFPQMIRNLLPLIQGKDLGELRPLAGKPLPIQAVGDALPSTASVAELLVSAAAARLANEFLLAGALLDRAMAKADKQTRDLVANEQAALAWHSGRHDEARTMWQEAKENAVTLFNRGLAALFLDDAQAAKACLARAVPQLAESSAWHHLANLYLTLAAMRA